MLGDFLRVELPFEFPQRPTGEYPYQIIEWVTAHGLPLMQPLTGNLHEWRHTETQRHLPRPFPKRPPEAEHEHRCGRRGHRVSPGVQSRE
jgi:hypothetical protein